MNQLINVVEVRRPMWSNGVRNRLFALPTYPTLEIGAENGSNSVLISFTNRSVATFSLVVFSGARSPHSPDPSDSRRASISACGVLSGDEWEVKRIELVYIYHEMFSMARSVPTTDFGVIDVQAWPWEMSFLIENPALTWYWLNYDRRQ